MNIALVTVDALRPDQLGCYGYDGPTSPNIDAFASDATVFENAVSNGPGTKFAFKPLFTGRHAQEFPEVLGIPESGKPTISECLSDAGYETGGFHTNGFLAEEFNYERGFDTFHGPDTWPTDSPQVRASIKDNVRRHISDIDILYRYAAAIYDTWMMSDLSTDEDPRTYRTADEVNDVVFNWLDDREDEFFLWVHYMDVHEPYIYRDEYISAVTDREISDARFRRARTPSKVITEESHHSDEAVQDVLALYDSEIRFLDEHIGRLFNRLEDTEEETLIVFTADHGESFGEQKGNFHGEAPHWNAIDVPLMTDGPDVASRRVESWVSHLAVPPTILQRAGVPVPDCYPDLDCLTDPDREETIFIEYLEEWEPAYGCIHDGWKYVYETVDDGERLYDLEADPREENDVIDDHPEVKSRFKTILDNHLAEYGGGLGEPSFDRVSDGVAENLEDLGYI